MMTFTDIAKRTVRAYMAQGYVENPALRIAVLEGSSPVAPDYDICLIEEGEQETDDLVFDAGEFKVVVDSKSAPKLEGFTVDYVDGTEASGFQFRGPAATKSTGNGAAGPLIEQVRQVIEERVNPAVSSHGGRITLVDVRDNIVYLELSGGCQGCGMARVTLKQGVERMIREVVPEIVEIRDVTDHASGTNPYYEAPA